MLGTTDTLDGNVSGPVIVAQEESYEGSGWRHISVTLCMWLLFEAMGGWVTSSVRREDDLGNCRTQRSDGGDSQRWKRNKQNVVTAVRSFSEVY